VYEGEHLEKGMGLLMQIIHCPPSVPPSDGTEMAYRWLSHDITQGILYAPKKAGVSLDDIIDAWDIDDVEKITSHLRVRDFTKFLPYKWEDCRILGDGEEGQYRLRVPVRHKKIEEGIEKITDFPFYSSYVEGNSAEEVQACLLNLWRKEFFSKFQGVTCVCRK
jgi:hypothetical protein